MALVAEHVEVGNAIFAAIGAMNYFSLLVEASA